ncbi:hypothetical protein ABZ471_47860, partial [Streptomyces sp. NPDC005728]
ERVSDLQGHLMASIAVPAVLLRLDTAADRGARVHAAALELRQADGQGGQPGGSVWAGVGVTVTG